EKLLQTDAYRQAKRIGAYLCLPEEVNVKSIIEAAWADGKSVYLPVVLDWGQVLKFAPYTPDSKLIRDRLDIEIPAVCATKYLEASALDMVVTPLVAFDEQRNRIGMGGGFYDRTFAFKAEAKPFSKPQLIGVAFETQRLPVTITANPWDICPDAIITEQRIYTP
ncbi:MAG: 5-formyltetrahydrofolate cyclo-ligase, partial [Gammaproteobacteria bacterium]